MDNTVLLKMMDSLLSGGGLDYDGLIGRLEAMGFDIQEEERYLVKDKYDVWLTTSFDLDKKVGEYIKRGYGPSYVSRVVAKENADFNIDKYDWAEAYRIAINKSGNRTGKKRQGFLYRRGFLSNSVID